MFALNPFGKTGIICDTCSVIIYHEIDADMASEFANGDHFCVSCFEKIEEDNS